MPTGIVTSVGRNPSGSMPGVLDDGVVEREVVEPAVGAGVHRLEDRELRIGEEHAGVSVVARRSPPRRATRSSMKTRRPSA